MQKSVLKKEHGALYLSVRVALWSTLPGRRLRILSFVREESFGSVRIFFLEKEKLLEALEKEARRLGEENHEVEKIVLFGSLACDRALPRSDADILVVLTESKKPFIERIKEWLVRICIDFPVDVFPYTKEELSNSLAQEALKNGKVLFERKCTV